MEWLNAWTLDSNCLEVHILTRLLPSCVTLGYLVSVYQSTYMGEWCLLLRAVGRII